jgi:2-dehydropantoate 2-reductase
MKTYVVGSGGVGGYFGGLLAKAGNDVTFVARGEHYKAIKGKGLGVKSVVGDFEIKPAQVIEKISEITSPDLVIFAVKTYDTDKAAKELAPVVNKNTVIITFQNGVDNDNQIKKHIKNTQVYPGVAYVISTKTQPGLIEQTGGLRKLIFGDRNNPNNPKLKEIEKLMRKTEIDATASDDIARDLWRKFMFITAFSGMTAICRSRIGEVLGDPLTKSLYERCVKEAINVAKAMKVNVANDVIESIMTISGNTASDSKSSLLVDIENNRKNEIETLNGTLIRFAKKHNVDVPINELIYGAIKLVSPK